MGALHKLDLTSDVTHLIVGSITTPKYRYVAKERPDIKVLKPEWIEAVLEMWRAGEDVDVRALESEHRFPIFFHLQICVTGFEDLVERDHITETVRSEGASYHGDLIKGQVTHLIAAAPEGKKYNAAKQWGVSIVSAKWFHDSMRRGMALEESLYDPVLPLTEQGKGAFRVQPRPPIRTTSLGKHGRESESAPAPEAAKKKLRRSMSSRLESQSQDMWQDISAHTVEVHKTETDQWTDRGERSTIAAGKDATSVGQDVAEAEIPPAKEPQGMFGGAYVLIHSFTSERRDKLKTVLELNGATVVNSATELEDASRNPFFQGRYLLVPHDASFDDLANLRAPGGTVVASEWWPERSLFHSRLLNPTEDQLSRPARLDKSHAFFDRVIIHSTGFNELDYRQISESAKLVGAEVATDLIRSTSVIVSGSNKVKTAKAIYAQRHSIPIVSAEWLWRCFKDGRQIPTQDFLIPLPKYDPAELDPEGSAGSPATSDAQTGPLEDGEKRLATFTIPFT
jgi:DNA replication regulator DPB11